MISRRDDEDVVFLLLLGGATKKSGIFELPFGRDNFEPSSALLVAHVSPGYASRLAP